MPVNAANTPLSVALASQIRVEGKDLQFFQSAEITGTGSEANTAHGLVDADGIAKIPIVVIVYLTQKDTTTAVDIVEGTHDATNIKVDCETTAKYKIFAM